MIYADGMHGRFRLGYGAQFIHVAAAMAEDRAEIDRLVASRWQGCRRLHVGASMVARYLPGAWRRVKGGDEDMRRPCAAAATAYQDRWGRLR